MVKHVPNVHNVLDLIQKKGGGQRSKGSQDVLCGTSGPWELSTNSRTGLGLVGEGPEHQAKAFRLGSVGHRHLPNLLV